MRRRPSVRVPVPASAPGPLTETPPARVARLLLPLLLLAGLVYLLVWACDDDGSHPAAPPPPPPSPPTLTTGALVDPRGLAGRACLALVSDVSSSMSAWAPTRAAALAQLRDFSRAKNLRDDDLLSVFAFDDHATAILPPTRIQDLTNAPLAEPRGGGGTVFGPAVDAVSRAFAGRQCSATGVAVISDGLISDDPTALAGQLGAAGFTRLWFLVPGRLTARPTRLSAPALGAVGVRGFTDTTTLGAAYGQLLAEITGQRFAVRRSP